jgi:DNA-binding MarR family transcriptional regulator
MAHTTRTHVRRKSAAEQFDLRRSPGYLIRRCHQRSRQIFDELIGADTGLSRQQVAVLIGIDQNPHVTQARLSEATGFDRNTLAELMSRLISKKLVERRRAQSDARAYEVTLSSMGAQQVRAIYPRMRQVQAQLLAPLPTRLRPTFLGCLQMLSDSFVSSGSGNSEMRQSSPKPGTRRRRRSKTLS